MFDLLFNLKVVELYNTMILVSRNAVIIAMWMLTTSVCIFIFASLVVCMCVFFEFSIELTIALY